jgi:hypothetical protein
LIFAIEGTVSFGGKRSARESAFYFIWDRNLEGSKVLRRLKNSIIYQNDLAWHHMRPVVQTIP